MIIDRLASYAGAVLIASLALCWAVDAMHLRRAQSELAALKTSIAQEHEAAERAKAQALEGWRADEKRHNNVVLTEVRNAHDSLDRAGSAAVRAAAAGDGLRVRTEALAARCGGAPEAAAAAAGSPTAQEAGLLLADVSRRLDEAGQQLADLAERSLIAGQTCERIGDSMTE